MRGVRCGVAECSIDDFEREVIEFLDANAERRTKDTNGFLWGEGDDNVALFEEIDPEAERAGLTAAKAWRAARFDAGLGWIAGPVEYGGRGLPVAYERRYASIERGYRIPDQSYFGIGFGMIAPTILAHATEETKQRYLPAMYRGDVVACQLFSEPSAGSDLASLRTTAVRDGDEWVATGQKVWTSGAQYSEIGEIICRTDPDLPKHKGLTGFVIDMRAHGVDVRPLRQMTGGASFNEVFFNEVRIPDANRLGEVNGGWTVALTTLMNERMAIGAGGAGLPARTGTLDRLLAMVHHFDLDRDPLVRQELARVATGLKLARLNGDRAVAAIKAGQLPGPELSAGKLALTENLRTVSRFVSLVLGPRLVADTGEWGTYAWSQLVLGVPGLRVAGGTDEVMKNIIGERVLGLPKG
jgi:alkylation response protein AidB-like acyl-CoA dehydrogenase